MSPVKTACAALILLVSSLLRMHTAFAQVDQIMPITAAYGGSAFSARCAQGDILNGFDLTVADDIDSIRPICVTAYTQNASSDLHVYNQKFGGDTGSPVRIVCPRDAPAIAAIQLLTEGRNTLVVNTINLFCSVAAPNQPATPYPSAGFDAPHGGSSGWAFKQGGWFTRTCPAGLVPVGITGRSGIWLDSMGLICGALRLAPSKQPIGAIGRVNTGASPPRPEMSICEAARDARARNSPAAPNLERQCAAIPSPVTAIGRVGGPDDAPRQQHSVCDAAVDARARNSPAAANLEKQCQAAGGIYKMSPSADDYEVVRARGAQIRQDDLNTIAIFNSLPTVSQRGFDIGLGIWGSQSAPGPGKQRYRDFLKPPEQQGFDAAAAYALPSNKYSSLVNVGGTITRTDAGVRKARSAVSDGFYWLGFDIASGLFGDPKAGAEGSKVLGAGAIAIRNDLNTPGQNGFNASMKFHLSRNYK